MYLANTGVALRNSPGSAHYNPALLTTLRSPKFTISANNFTFLRTRFQDHEELDGKKIGFNVNSFEPIPSTSIQTFNYFGGYQALFILVPSSLTADKRSTLRTNNTEITLFNVNASQEIRAGGAWAQKLDAWLPGLSIGASLYALRLHDISTMSVTALADPSFNTVSMNSGRDESTFYGLAGSFGLAYLPNETWTLGLRWESPLVRIHSSADGFSQTINVQNGVLSESKEIGPKSIQHDRPMSLALGVTYSPSPHFRISTDAYVFTPLSYKQFSSKPERVRSGWNYETHSGLQYHPFRWLRLSSGFQFNPGGMKKNSSEDNMDFWGVSGGADYLGEKYSFGAGGFFIGGHGRTESLASNNLGSTIDIKLYGVLISASRNF